MKESKKKHLKPKSFIVERYKEWESECGNLFFTRAYFNNAMAVNLTRVIIQTMQMRIKYDKKLSAILTKIIIRLVFNKKKISAYMSLAASRFLLRLRKRLRYHFFFLRSISPPALLSDSADLYVVRLFGVSSLLSHLLFLFFVGVGLVIEFVKEIELLQRPVSLSI